MERNTSVAAAAGLKVSDPRNILGITEGIHLVPSKECMQVSVSNACIACFDPSWPRRH